MIRTTKILAALAIAAAATGSTSYAAVPTVLHYQGVLTDGGGTPITAPTSVTFTLWNAPNLGTVKWSETRTVDPDDAGRFAILLGQAVPLHDSVFKFPPLYLGVKVESEAEMTPRFLIATNAFAFRTSTLDGASGGSVSGNLDLEVSSIASGNILKDGLLFVHNYGTSNTFVGLNSGNLTTTGVGQNTACGAAALLSNTSGAFNTALGRSALASNLDGSNNTASGWGSLANNTTGSNNTASGYHSLIVNSSGDENSAVGHHALANNGAGDGNSALGAYALQSSTGDSNTAVGYAALFNNSSGSNLTAIGNGADVTSPSLTNATAIGNGARVNASNKIRLGNSGVTVIEGQVAYTFSSDATQKENFQAVDGGEVLDKIRRLSITSWNYKGQDPKQFRHYGPVAQEFFQAFGNDGVGTSGTPTTINTGDVAGILMIAVQTLHERNLELEGQIAELRTLIESR